MDQGDQRKKGRKSQPASRQPSSDHEDTEDLGGGTWEALATFWPIEDRPMGIFRRKKWVDSQPLETMLKLMEAFEKKQRDLNTGGGTQRDTKPAVINIKKGKDDHFEVLADCRFEMMRPLSPWEYWWPLVPAQRKERYKALDLVSLGMEAQVAKAAINRYDGKAMFRWIKFLFFKFSFCPPLLFYDL